MQEYYAGVGRIARLASANGYKACAFDVTYDLPEVTDTWPNCPSSKARMRGIQTGKKVGMDLTTDCGFTLLG